MAINGLVVVVVGASRRHHGRGEWKRNKNKKVEPWQDFGQNFYFLFCPFIHNVLYCCFNFFFLYLWVVSWRRVHEQKEKKKKKKKKKGSVRCLAITHMTRAMIIIIYILFLFFCLKLREPSLRIMVTTTERNKDYMVNQMVVTTTLRNLLTTSNTKAETAATIKKGKVIAMITTPQRTCCQHHVKQVW